MFISETIPYDQINFNAKNFANEIRSENKRVQLAKLTKQHQEFENREGNRECAQREKERNTNSTERKLMPLAAICFFCTLR